MDKRVVFKPTGEEGKSEVLPLVQPFLYPAGQFEGTRAEAPALWSCVRTRPRWEKKFAEWMIERHRS